jgi:hypothetical protein
VIDVDATQVLLKVLDVANPLAGMVAEFVAGKLGLSEKSIDAVQQTISGMSGGDQVKLKQIAADLQDHLAGYGVQLQIADLNAQAVIVGAVNSTLQADARGESWLQQNHHAIESMTTVALMVAVYFVIPIAPAIFGMAKIEIPAIPNEAFLMLGAVLGVTAWQHGAVNIAKQG